ncbi:MAG: hypothetical protein KF819_12805 [Labilithrix sp.]|nr:hypothetical protein [Labilithrix sp.]
MRNVLLVAVVGLATVSILGCGDASSSTGIRRGPVAAGDHDPDDSQDEGKTDPGNPNATTPPAPPSNPGTSTGQIAVSVSNATPAVDLGAEVKITVTLTPQAGFQGTADLTATGLPEGVTGTFSPAQVAVNTTPVTSELTLKVAFSATASAAGASSQVVVNAKSGDATASANVSFKINPAITIAIPVNVNALRTTGTVFLDQYGTAFGTNPQALKTQAGNPIVVKVNNLDSVTHIIHGPGGAFPHGDTGNPIPATSLEMQNGAPRTRTLPVGTNVSAYLHEGNNGQSASFRISVVAAP